ncbi:Metallo-dependent phosphatase-like protein [Gymnopilus junonius]|uniref:Metallo-dependent phosphatase-like protein n=1 Tax=Gymnopilus junonius TaxID=109634 RepID=A0A9P5TPB2_GYMJU|nr:Metallo-dependent phosphatase-like protein [Gymnopilus junonius]
MSSRLQILSYVIVSVFLVFFMSCGIADSLRKAYSENISWRPLSHYQGHETTSIPDVAHYVHVRKLSQEEFPLDDPKKRAIIVGDVHGMINSLEKLLKRVKYSSSNDVLIHVGDVAVKASHAGSLAVLKFMSSNNVIGVRGNHDQKIIEWRGWLTWVFSVPGATKWLERLENKWSEAQRKDPDLDLETWLEKRRKSSTEKDIAWWKLIPKDWIIFSDHYQIAKDMSDADFHYLLKLPLRLYIPSAHAFIVHAGLLPSDPDYPRDDKARQPLAAVPDLPHPQRPTVAANITWEEALQEDLDDPTSYSSPTKTIEHLRNLQEIAILTRIPQNKDPWAVLNMRSIIDGEVSKKSNKGTPWAKIWKDHMKHCVGFRNELENELDDDYKGRDRDIEEQNLRLKCYPSTVIYGHAASRGLDIKRWSFGLDSGCIYRRRLSALVIQGRAESSEEIILDDLSDDNFDEDAPNEDEDDDIDGPINTYTKKSLPFGDHNTADIVSVKCTA